MLKTLVKKQYWEIFKPYFINKKTGKAISKRGTIFRFVMFALLMLFLCAAFFGLSALMGNLCTVGLDWLYFTLMAIISVALGVFGSVFNTYAGLYLAKDNDMLISMPIKASTILLSRMASVLGMAALYSLIVWIPACLYYWIFHKPTAAIVVFNIILMVLIALFVTVVTCALGWLVALISGKLKNKSIITVIIGFAFFIGYYYVCFNMNSMVESMMENSAVISNNVKRFGNILYAMGLAASGNIFALLTVSVIVIALTVLCYVILSKSFFYIVRKSNNVAKRKVTAEQAKAAVKAPAKQNSLNKALFKREMKRFLASPTYIMNCGFGIVIMPILAIIMFVKRSAVTEALDAMTYELGIPVYESASLFPLGVFALIGLIVSINTISTPSISLEGKNLWILKSLPVDGADVLHAKINVHVILNVIPAIFTGVVFCYCMGADALDSLLAMVAVYLFVTLTGTIGLMIGLKRPNFTWSTETIPIKQSLNTLFIMLIGWAAVAVCTVPGFMLSKHVSSNNYLIILIVVLVLVIRLLNRWIRTRGSKLFASL